MPALRAEMQAHKYTSVNDILLILLPFHFVAVDKERVADNHDAPNLLFRSSSPPSEADLALIVQVALVPHKDHIDVARAVLLDVVHPFANVRKSGGLGHIVHQQYAVCAPIIYHPQ